MIEISNDGINLDTFEQIAFHNQKITLSESSMDCVKDSFRFLEEFSINKVIYGINTGFGPMAQYRIGEDKTIQLQYNLIRSHCSGSGKTIDSLLIRGIMIARLNTLLKGYSGIHESLLELLCTLINTGIYPIIKEHGGVGASGDLVQLAHLALMLIGEGEVLYEGKSSIASEVFALNKITPAKIFIREGIATMNGTSAMTGIGLVNIIYAKRLLEWNILASAAIIEIVESYDDHFSEELNKVKLHEGQNEIAAKMRFVLKDCSRVRNRSEEHYNIGFEENVFKNKVQEYYSIRCVPQILGPILDTIKGAENVLVNELNSVNDNPIIDHINKNVYHGGNFHGDYVSLEMDKLKIAITKLSILAERQLNYLLNDKLNGILPPFLNMGVAGLNFGLQGMQFTATSTVAENQTLCFPMYVHSIPNNNDNQDVVSMGANAALLTHKVIMNTFEVIAIQHLAISRAVSFLKLEKELSSSIKKHFTNPDIFPSDSGNDSIPYVLTEKIKHVILNNLP